MAAINTRLHHPRLPLSRPPCRARSYIPCLRSRSASGPLPPPPTARPRHPSWRAATTTRSPTQSHVRSRLNYRRCSSPPPQAALALSGGSVGVCDDDSSPFSSSSSSSSEPKKEAEGTATHVSVGTVAAPPVAASPDMRFWGNVAFASAGAAVLFLAVQNITPPRETTAVFKLQVALRGTAMAKSLQKDLNAIAEKVEASNRRWYKFILAETISSLRRHKDFCSSSSLSAIRSVADLEAAVKRLSSTPESELRGVHVLSASQEEDDVLSEERIQKDYPYLKPLRDY